MFTKERKVWYQIMHRVRTEGRCIDDRWMTFVGFLRSMGPMPEGAFFIRRDPHEWYFPENCFWGTREQKGGRTAQGRYFREWRQKRKQLQAA